MHPSQGLHWEVKFGGVLYPPLHLSSHLHHPLCPSASPPTTPRRRDEADRALLRSKGQGGDDSAAGGRGALALAPHERGLHPDVEDDIEAMLQGEEGLGFGVKGLGFRAQGAMKHNLRH